MDGEEKKLIAILAVIFLLLIAGCASPFDSGDGTGELTVSVKDQDGNPIEEQPVTVRNKETKKVVFKGSTNSSGLVSATLDHGTYVVATDDKAKTVQLDGDMTQSFQIVADPPNSPESFFQHSVAHLY